MRTEGIDLPTGELGWLLREKLGLPLGKQLFETALQGPDKIEDVEAEALRLFKDLHASDALFRKLGRLRKSAGRSPGERRKVRRADFPLMPSRAAISFRMPAKASSAVTTISTPSVSRVLTSFW